MDIIEALKADHEKVRAMFQTLEKTTPAASKTRVDLLAKLESELRDHMRFEEETLYPEIKAGADKDGRELAVEAVAEHESALTTLSRLKEAPTQDETWKAWLTVLREGIEHHVEEEETELFIHARKIIPAGRRMETRQRGTAKRRSRSRRGSGGCPRGYGGVPERARAIRRTCPWRFHRLWWAAAHGHVGSRWPPNTKR